MYKINTHTYICIYTKREDLYLERMGEILKNRFMSLGRCQVESPQGRLAGCRPRAESLPQPESECIQRQNLLFLTPLSVFHVRLPTDCLTTTHTKRLGYVSLLWKIPSRWYPNWSLTQYLGAVAQSSWHIKWTIKNNTP